MKARVQLMLSLPHEPYCLSPSVIPKLETSVVPRRSGTCSRTAQSQLGLGPRASESDLSYGLALSLAKLPWASCLTSLESAGYKIGNNTPFPQRFGVEDELR